MEEQSSLARRRRALERRSADAHDRAAGGERREHIAEPLRASGGVELVLARREPRRRREVVVGAECDDEDVGFVHAGGGRHAERVRVDRRDPLAQERDARLGEVGVGHANVLGGGAAEHDVELRVSEDERVARLDQRDAGLVAEGVGEDRRELEPAEPRSQDEDALRHHASLATCWR